MRFQRLATFGALALAGLVSGCAVYPAYPVAQPVVYASPGVYTSPGVVYAQPAPVVVAPPPVYYGPAVYPSISIFGRFGSGGHRHYHGGYGRGRH